MDAASRLKHIQSMDDEVKVLHPFLESLLPQIPGIQYVEYTHGNSEMGADFVLEKLDDSLGVAYHIGVIVKADSITQNITDVDRQIDECGNRRKFRKGAVEIRLKEIWVITSKSISTNAQERILTKFATKKIEFIDAAQLMHLTDRHADFLWHELPAKISTYLNRAHKYVTELDNQTSLSISSAPRFYIDLDLRKCEESAYSQKHARHLQPINAAEVIGNERFALIEGDMGSGKSKLLRHHAIGMAVATTYKADKRVPIFVPYKSFIANQAGSLFKLVTATLEDALVELDRDNAELTIFLDGLDEAFHSEDECVTELLRLEAEFATVSQPMHVVVSSKPLIDPTSYLKLDHHVKRFVIRPISLKKLIKFIEETCCNTSLSSRLFDDLRKSHLFQALPQNPIAAVLLSNLLADGEKELPSNMTELYSRSLDLMLGKWDVGKGIMTQKQYQTSLRACSQLAQLVVDGQLDQIDAKQALSVFEKFIQDRNFEDVNASHLFESVIGRSGVLARSLDGASVFFKHRSFAQYLYALEAHQTNALPVDKRAFDSYWTNIYFFYAGLHKDCPSLLRDLLSAPTTTESERWSKVFNSGQLLMAAFTTPYEITEQYLDKIFLEAASLLIDVRAGRSKTKLDQIPEMHALWLIQRVLRDHYGYPHFKKALSHAVLQVADAAVDLELKQLTLFLLGTLGLELGDESAFKFLLKEYGADKLPMYLSFAVQCESQLNDSLENKPFIRLHRKRFQRILPQRPYERNRLISQLFEAPMVKLAHKHK